MVPKGQVPRLGLGRTKPWVGGGLSPTALGSARGLPASTQCPLAGPTARPPARCPAHVSPS